MVDNDKTNSVTNLLNENTLERKLFESSKAIPPILGCTVLSYIF